MKTWRSSSLTSLRAVEVDLELPACRLAGLHQAVEKLDSSDRSKLERTLKFDLLGIVLRVTVRAPRSPDAVDLIAPEALRCLFPVPIIPAVFCDVHVVVVLPWHARLPFLVFRLDN